MKYLKMIEREIVLKVKNDKIWFSDIDFIDIKFTDIPFEHLSFNLYKEIFWKVLMKSV